MKIKFEVIIESGDTKHVKALNTFMKAVSGTATVAKEEPAKEEPAKEEPAKEEPAKEETQEDKIMVKDIRALLSKKVEDHREEIKEKLTELGAKNVSSLEEDDYEEFVEFLNDLD